MLLILLDIIQSLLGEGGQPGDLGPFRVFQYITVRAGAALFIAFFVSLLAGPRVIEWLRGVGAKQIVRRTTKEDAISLHDMHGQKEGTPSMGGVLIMLSLFVSAFIFCRLSSGLFWVMIAMSVSFAVIGFWDDYRKIIARDHHGLSPRGKLTCQGLVALALGFNLWRADWSVYYAWGDASGYAYLLVPFFKGMYPAMGIAFVPFVVLVLACTSNAVNLTDGLDGLAIGVSLICTMAFTVMAYLASHNDFASYLFIPFVPGAGELVVYGAAMVGASLGFLWFNSHPAQVFMGDTGSMMLGGTLGAMALLIKQEILLILIGGIFVIEAMSVILQVGSYKLRGKRIFRMSPLHHHYEKLGLHENKIIIRFWTVSLLLALLGLATLKLR